MADTTQHRGVVTASQGMAAASQPLAVSAGLQALQNGGSAQDAAIAISAVLCVVEPHASHLGGDAFVIVWDNAQRKATALNGSGAAPMSASPDRFANGIPLRGPAAASVPGLVDVWSELHRQGGRLPFANLLAAACRYAESGYPAGGRTAGAFAFSADLWKEFPETLQALTGQNTPPAQGEMLRQPELAATLALIAEQGRDAFYDGPIAEKIAMHCSKNGGYITRTDLAAHRTQVLQPISTGYRSLKVYGQPPVSQGHILLQELNLLEGFDLRSMGHNSAQAIHCMVEAKKLAFADRHAYLGDPDFVPVPVQQLLSKEYAAERRKLIQPDRALAMPAPGDLLDHDTTYFCVVDGEGNAVSFIQSVFWGYGCGSVAAGTGVLLNNRMSGFTLQQGHPNCLAPDKRTAHTLNAWLATRNRQGEEQLALAGGTPGADYQVQTNMQIICNIEDFGLNPQQAVEAARWQHGLSVRESNSAVEQLQIEERIPEEVRRALQGMGHSTVRIGAFAQGGTVQLIEKNAASGALLAGSDPRSDGHAAGF